MEIMYSISRFVYQAVPELPTLLLFLLLYLAWDIKRMAEKGVFWGDVFNDENGKRSTLRVAALYAFALSSALLLYIAMNTKNPADSAGLLWFYGLYVGVWSGAPVAAKFLDSVAAKAK